MKRRSSPSNFISSFNHGSNFNNLGSIQQNVDSVNASGQGDHRPSIGWIGQSSSIGSSHNPVTPEELKAEQGWLPSPVANIGTSQRLEERPSEPNSDINLGSGLVTLGPSTSQSGTSDAVAQKLDLNVAYGDSSGTILREIGADYMNQISSLEGNTEIFERNTRRRINPVNEQYFPSSSMSSSVRAGVTSQTLQPSYTNWITSPSSSSISSVSPVTPASGSDAWWQEENTLFLPRSTSVQSMLVPGTESGNPGQNLITSRAFLRNYRSQNGSTSVQLGASPGFPQHNVTRGFQNGFTGGVHLSSAPGFPPRNMAEEYAERLSDVVNNSMMRLAGFGSGGRIGCLRPPSSALVTMRGMLESRPGNLRATQALPRPRILRMRAEGRNALVPPILPPLQPLAAAQWRARLLAGLIIQGPTFYEEPEGHDVHEDMRLDVDNMSYEELLALEEQIGNVSTGLSEEAILGCMSQHRYQSMKLGSPVEEPCCICQDDFIDDEELAKLDCGHDFHFNCIKKWLMQKNTCPICKANALAI